MPRLTSDVARGCRSGPRTTEPALPTGAPAVRTGQTDFDALEHLDFVHELSAEDMVPDDVILQTEERGFIMGWAARAYDAAQELTKTPIGNMSKPNPNLPVA